MSDRMKKTVLSALLSALTCVATLAVRIPLPVTGYLHFGDGLVLLSGWMLGGYGALAAALGSTLSDILSGYALFAPATFLIKGGMALIAAGVFSLFRRRKSAALPCVVSGMAAELFMVGGYFLYTVGIVKNPLAAVIVGLPGDGVQALFGVISGTLLYLLVRRLHLENL